MTNYQANKKQSSQTTIALSKLAKTVDKNKQQLAATTTNQQTHDNNNQQPLDIPQTTVRMVLFKQQQQQ